MRRGPFTNAAVLIAGLLVAAGDGAGVSGLDPSGFDRSVRPQDDLFQYVNGGWMARAEIPPDRVSRDAFTELADQTDTDLRRIIEDLGDERRGAARQIADLYASLVNEARAEELGATPIRPELQRIDAISTTREFAAQAGHLSANAGGGPFNGVVDVDATDATMPIVRLTQGGTLLPDRDYYLNPDPKSVAIRAKYQEYLANVFTLIDRPRAFDDARAVLALETELARIQWTQVDSRDSQKISNKLALSQLPSLMPGFDWMAWARPQGIDRTPNIVIAQPSFFKSFAAMVPTTPLETWKAWLTARYVTASAPFLSKAFNDTRFEFFGRVLSGQEVPRPRWKRGVSLVNTYLGDAIGRRYVERHFPPSSRARMQKLTDDLLKAYRQAISDLDWMSAATRREALDKLSKLSMKIGYPDKWKSYNGLVIRADDLVGNITRAQRFESEYRMARLREPADRTEWLMTPQTVNAYYSAALNEIVVPAAVLQPPLFNPGADDAVNYGGVGAFIGHEIGHAFDETGRRLDGRGALRDWWRPDDERKFRLRAQALVEQFNAYESIDGLHVNGALTLRENAGDLTGLSIAYRAYKLSLGGRPAPVIDGFTGEQRFFMGWAQVWRSKVRGEYLRQWLLAIPHAPPRYRANGAVSNLSGFYDAFGVRPGDKMYRDPEKRVSIW